MTLRCVARYSNGEASWAPGDFAEGLSEDQEEALLRDSPGAFERVEVIRFTVAPGPDADAARAAALDAAEELLSWRRRWSALCEVIEANGDTVGPDVLPGYLREVLTGRGTLAEQVKALATANEAQAATLEAQAATLAELGAKLAALAPPPEPAKAKTKKKDEAPGPDAGEG